MLRKMKQLLLLRHVLTERINELGVKEKPPVMEWSLEKARSFHTSHHEVMLRMTFGIHRLNNQFQNLNANYIQSKP